MIAPGRIGARHGLRIRLTVASFLLSALVVTGAVAALITALQHDAAAGIEARLRDRAAALAATVDTSSGTVDITGADDALLDSPNWVFDAAGRRIEGATPPRSVRATVARLGASTGPAAALTGTLHLRSLPVTSGGRLVAVVVTGVDEAPVAATLDATTRGAVLLGVLAVVGATGLAGLVLGRSLGPIATMTDRAAEWGRLHSARRFALGPPRDELTALAAVLDDLLDRVDAALSAERRLTAELAHELRTPLTLLAGEADLALMSRSTSPAELPRYERIREAAGAMARAVTALLDGASADAAAESDVADAVAAVVAVLGRSVPVRFEGASATVPVPFGHLERMLGPVLDNATTAAASVVRVRVRAEEDAVGVVVSDDGTGVPDRIVHRLFDAGATTRLGGTGLGLALARRLAREAGGDLELLRPRPATFLLRLPRSHDTGGHPLRSRPDGVKAR